MCRRRGAEIQGQGRSSSGYRPPPLALSQVEPDGARSCGACRACCRILGVETLQKPPFQPCPFLSARGCACYTERPDECREYRCYWLAGHGDPRDRPDRLGVIFDDHEPMFASPAFAAIPALVAREILPGARARRRAAALIDALATKMVVFVSAYGAAGKAEIRGPAASIVALEELGVLAADER